MKSESRLDLPIEYSKIEDTLISAEKILIRAVDDAKSLFHTPIVSSIKNNQITSRVMVLREFDLKDRKMRFHTDFRASKIHHYEEDSSATVIGYDPEIKIQIKLQGNMSIHYDDETTKLAWDNSTSRSKKCYSVKGGSSKEISNPEEYDIKDFKVEEGYKNFAVLVFHFNSLEFLYLKSSGHRRAIHKWNDEYDSKWLVP
ncbi:MAG: pyridoxamine 5'-phosphate oxidase [Gammaproteobacteria bacterium]|nr:pyridoxamine 5'-phosphate oxidase [Gammaproteobacteria bacterium]